MGFTHGYYCLTTLWLLLKFIEHRNPEKDLIIIAAGVNPWNDREGDTTLKVLNNSSF